MNFFKFLKIKRIPSAEGEIFQGKSFLLTVLEGGKKIILSGKGAGAVVEKVKARLGEPSFEGVNGYIWET